MRCGVSWETNGYIYKFEGAEPEVSQQPHAVSKTMKVQPIRSPDIHYIQSYSNN